MNTFDNLNILAYCLIFVISLFSTVILVARLTRPKGDNIFIAVSLYLLRGPNSYFRFLLLFCLQIVIFSSIYKVIAQPGLREYCLTDMEHVVRGENYYKNSNYEKAIEDFNIAITKNPNNYLAFNDRGKVYQHWGKWDNAKTDFIKAIHLNEKFAMGYANLGEVNVLTKNYDDDALSVLSIAIKLGANDYRNYLYRGITYEFRYQFKDALQDYDTALVKNVEKQDKTSDDKEFLALIYYHRSLMYSNLGNNQNAKTDLAKALSLGFPIDTIMRDRK
jgi:tetratricopeptide (TPR) repeat protein